MRATAVIASVVLSKIAAIVSAGSGAGRRASVAWVMTPSVPSEPTPRRPASSSTVSMTSGPSQLGISILYREPSGKRPADSAPSRTSMPR